MPAHFFKLSTLEYKLYVAAKGIPAVNAAVDQLGMLCRMNEATVGTEHKAGALTNFEAHRHRLKRWGLTSRILFQPY